MRAEVAERVAPLAAGLLLAAPVLVAFYPPMTDLPLHEAAAGILRHFDDRAMFPPGLYLHNFGEPNQLFHLLGWLFSYAMSTRWAMKLVVAIAVVAVPVSGARFARHTGGSPLAALAIAPMALGWLFSWGLVANLFGLAALLLTLPVLDRYADRPTPRGAGMLAVCIVGLYFAHDAMMLVFGMMAGVLAVVCPWSARRTPARFAPVAAVALVHEAFDLHQQRFMTPIVRGLPTFWHPFWHKVVRVPYILTPATDNTVRLGMLALILLAVVSFFVLRTRERRGMLGVWPAASRLEWWRRHAHAYRFEIFACICFAAYFTLPLTLKGATLVYQRFFPPAYAVLALVAAPATLSVRAARVSRICVLTLPVATLLVALPSFVDSSRQFRSLDALLPLIDEGSAVAEVDLGPGDPTRTYSLGPASGRVLATRGGRLAFAFTDSPISPVVLDRKYQWSESLIRIGFDNWAFRPEHDLHLFRYLLVRTTDPLMAVVSTYILQPTAEYLAGEGEWLLFRSKLPVIPLTSPSPRMEQPPPDSVRDLIHRALKELRDAPKLKVPDEPPANDPAAREADHGM